MQAGELGAGRVNAFRARVVLVESERKAGAACGVRRSREDRQNSDFKSPSVHVAASPGWHGAPGKTGKWAG